MLAAAINFNLLFHDNHQLMLVYDVDTLQLLEVNEACCKHYGYTRDEFLKLTIRDLRLPEDNAELDIALKEMKEKQLLKRAFRHIKKDGTLMYIEVNTYNLTFAGRHARLGMITDITEKKLHEFRLQKALLQMEHTLASISDGFFALNKSGTVVSWNKSAERLTGVSREAIINKNFWQTIPEARTSGFYSHFEEAVNSGSCVRFEEYFQATRKWFYCSIYPFADGVSIYFQNITELKQHQQELNLKNQRLEEVAYFNSHELRRPVANILGLYPLLSTTAGDTPTNSKEDILNKIYQSCQDIDEVIKRIDKMHFAG